MGWNFRKSIKIGPARINLSKSGVGYSVGAGGVRYTKRAGSKKKAKGSSLWESIKGFFCLILVIAVVGLIVNHWKWILAILGVGLLIGGTAYFLSKRKHDAAQPEPLPEPAAKDSDVFTYDVAGLSFYMDNLMSMMVPNYLYNYRKQELIDTCNTDINVYKQTVEDKQVELIPDPDNSHDPNAVKVLLGGKQIGFVPAANSAHILDLMGTGRIVSIAYTVQGGKYKRVDEDYDSMKDKSTYSMENGEDDYSVTLYIREQLQ